MAVGDVNGDGRGDLITAPGPGRAPTVKAFSGLDGSEVLSFDAFDAAFTGGLFVAAGDVTADGRAEVVVGQGADAASASLVRVYDVGGAAPVVLQEIAPYPGSTGGARVALVDLLGDGTRELLTATGPGLEPRVKAYVPATGTFIADALVFDMAFLGGFFVGS